MRPGDAYAVVTLPPLMDPNDMTDVAQTRIPYLHEDDEMDPVGDRAGKPPFLDSDEFAATNAQLNLPVGPGEVVTLRGRGLAAEDGDFGFNVIYRYTVDHQ